MIFDNVVLGAGIAGVGAAYAAHESGVKATIFEARSRPRGLLDSFVIDGFRFDTAVHLSFASEPEVRAVFDRTPYLTHSPDALCWDAPFWLKHPTQTNLHPLPIDQKVELIAGLAEASAGDITNYRDWLVQQYGEPIASRWPLVYTEKYWTLPAERLGTDWIGQRMRKADMREVLQGAFTPDTPNMYYTKEMRYPEHGGYGAFMQPMIDAVEIVFEHRVISIEPEAKTVAFENGRTLSYRNLVSTLPLPEIVEMMTDVPAPVRTAASSLFATEVDLISVGFRKPNVSPALWFYIYDEDIWASRAYSPEWKSPNNAPEGCSSLQFEIYSSRHKPQTHSPDMLKANTVEALAKMGLASRDDILFLDHRRLPYANVVFDLGMEERRDLVRNWVRSKGIATAGRFGEWDYLWSNQSMMSGWRAAESSFAFGDRNVVFGGS